VTFARFLPSLLRALPPSRLLCAFADTPIHAYSHSCYLRSFLLHLCSLPLPHHLPFTLCTGLRGAFCHTVRTPPFRFVRPHPATFTAGLYHTTPTAFCLFWFGWTTTVWCSCLPAAGAYPHQPPRPHCRSTTPHHPTPPPPPHMPLWTIAVFGFWTWTTLATPAYLLPLRHHFTRGRYTLQCPIPSPTPTPLSHNTATVPTPSLCRHRHRRRRRYDPARLVTRPHHLIRDHAAVSADMRWTTVV